MRLETEVKQIIPLLSNAENFPTSLPDSEKSENATIINFYLRGKVVPKARPRVTTNGTYLPPRYRAWRNQAEVEIYRQVSDLNLEVNLPIQRAAISISFCGKHRTNSDLDNLAGACLDALTLNGAGVLQDDRLAYIPKLNLEYIPNTKETGVKITIEILPVR
ncbi:MAG: RusA family crossover junction endodeoxyribonuclease [Okeania sp. SIO4D6]|nr:RusA family crossover junction endodeoxyribonuclease [Okeania sp. SIO4D6]